MVKIDKVVFDAGPFIHLHEINKLTFVNIFKNVLTTKKILEECKRIEKFIRKLKNVISKELLHKNKDFAKYLIEKYDLDLGESTGIALCKQEKIKLFFTDDLEARNIARFLGFKAHGTIAIFMRAYKNRVINKKEVKLSFTITILV